MTAALPSDPTPDPHLLTGEPTRVVRSRVGLRRLNTGLFTVGFGWIFVNAAISGVAMSAKIALLAPADKVFLLGLATGLLGIATTISVVLFGGLSDLTRSRWGSRTPWIVVGGLAGAAVTAVIALTDDVVVVVALVPVYGLVLNALTSAVVAIFPDRVPEENRGTASAVYGGAQVLAGTASAVLASRFLLDPDPFFLGAAVLLVVSVLLFVVLAPDFPNRDEPRSALDLRGLLRSFAFPRGAPDFYWAYAGRFLLVLGVQVVTTYQLYILTDYIGLSSEQAGDVIVTAGLAGLVTIIVGTVVAGPLSDRLGRRKMPIFVSSVLFAVAVLLPLVRPTASSMILFSAISNLGLGAFLSVDTALITQVLPNDATRGKDMGVLSTAVTLPAVFAPLIASVVVGAGLGYGTMFVAALVVVAVGSLCIFPIKGVR